MFQRQRTSVSLILFTTVMSITALFLTACFVLPGTESPPVQYIGYVRNVSNGVGIHEAKVTLEFQGAPSVTFTDAEGLYWFPISTDEEVLYCRVRVEATSYQHYDRIITLYADNAKIEDIRLIPNSQPAVNGFDPNPGEENPEPNPPVEQPPQQETGAKPASGEGPSPDVVKNADPNLPHGTLFESFETNNGTWKIGDQKNGTFNLSSTQANSGKFSGEIRYSFNNPGNDFVVFLHSYQLDGQPTGIKADVFGDGSGHYLNMWIKDAKGEIWQFTFGQVKHTGWQPMTAWLDPARGWPNGSIDGAKNGAIDYPISFYALALDDAPDNNSGNGVIYVDNLSVTTASPSPADPAPLPTPGGTPSTVPPPLSGRIAFPVDDGGGHYDIWIADLSQMPNVNPFFPPSLQGARQPHFCRADGQLLVNGEAGNCGLNIRLYSRNLDFLRMVSESPYDSYPYCAPAGERLVYSREDLSRVFVNCSMERPSNVTANEQCQRVEEFGVITTDYSGQLVADMPVWTQDGANLVVRWKMGAPNNGLAIIGSWAIPRDKNAVTPYPNPIQLLRSDSARPTDTWGNTVYFFAYDLSNNWEVYALSLSGGAPANLSNSAGSSDGLPAVSPDGRWVAFVSDRSGRWAVWAVPAQGGDPVWLFNFPKANPWGRNDHDWTTERISWGP